MLRLAILVVVLCQAAALVAPPLRRPVALPARPARAAVPEAAAPAKGESQKGLRARLGRQLKALRSKSKADLASLGLTSFFSYGIVSNINSVFLLAFTWASFRRANPLLSPLSDTAVLANPFTWFPLKGAFLAFYVAYYATIGSVLVRCVP